MEHRHTGLIHVERIAHRHTPLRAIAIVVVRHQVAEGDSVARHTLRLVGRSVSLDCRDNLAVQARQSRSVGHLRVAQHKERKLILLAVGKRLQRKVVATLLRVVSLIEVWLTKLTRLNFVCFRNCYVDIPSIACWHQLERAVALGGSNHKSVAHSHALDCFTIGVAHKAIHHIIVGNQVVILDLEALQNTSLATNIGNRLKLASNTGLDIAATPAELHLSAVGIEDIHVAHTNLNRRQSDIEHLVVSGR